MAQQTTISYLDDVDGGKAAETVAFALDGAHYEIDLSAKNAKTLRKGLAEFIEAGRQIKTPGTVRNPGRAARKSAAGAPKEDLAAVRTWANENGIVVAARGRISESVKEQYAASQAAA